MRISLKLVIQIISVLILVAGLGIGVFLVQKQQNLRSKASLSTTRIEFVGPNVIDGVAKDRNIKLKLVYVPPHQSPQLQSSTEPSVIPSAVPPPTSTPSSTTMLSVEISSPSATAIASASATPSPEPLNSVGALDVAVSPTPSPTPSISTTPAPAPIIRKVYLISFDPYVNNIRLSTRQGWGNWFSLSQAIMNRLNTASAGLVEFKYAGYEMDTTYPQKDNGFIINSDYYVNNCLGVSPTGNCNALADYPLIIRKFGLCEKLNAGTIDEVWLWGGPWFGFYESNLAGPGAFWYNSPPTTGTTCQKLLPIMGFNYERGVAEGLHDFGHRLESTMDLVFKNANTNNPWGLYKRQCGTTHIPANATQDYDYGNRTQFTSSCSDFKNYPNLTGRTASASCTSWSCDQEFYFSNWLFANMPRAGGETAGVLNNWWTYLADPQKYVIERGNVQGLSVAHALVFPTHFRVSNTQEGLSQVVEQLFDRNDKEIDWTLPEGNGEKTVYVQFKVNNIWEPPVTSKIILSIVEVSTAPIASASATITIQPQVASSSASISSQQTIQASGSAIASSPTPQSSVTPSPTINPSVKASSTPQADITKYDLNNDGVINIYDLRVIISIYNKPPNGSKADVNGDGIINIRDYSLVRKAFSLR